jgi:hypothetical protein
LKEEDRKDIFKIQLHTDPRMKHSVPWSFLAAVDSASFLTVDFKCDIFFA